MLDFLILILAGIGLSHILADSSIASSLKYKLLYKEDLNGVPQKRWAKRPRLEWFFDKFVEMLNCHQCNGFWSGLTVFAFYYFDVWFMLWAFAISLLSPIWAAFYVYVVSLTQFEESDENEE